MYDVGFLYLELQWIYYVWPKAQTGNHANREPWETTDDASGEETTYEVFLSGVAYMQLHTHIYNHIYMYIYILLPHSLPEMVFGIIQGTPVSSPCRHCAIHNHVQPLNVTWTPKMQTSRSNSIFGIPIFCFHAKIEELGCICLSAPSCAEAWWNMKKVMSS